jgi:predicted small lipoprotein YifL
MTTSTRTIVITGAIALATLAACSEKKGPAPAPPSTVTSTSREKGEMRQTATTTAQAKVVGVDQKDRAVTLQASDGHEFTIHVGDEVRNLPQVHKGDMVNVVYHEALAAKLVKKGHGKAGVQAAEGAERAPVGAMPAAAGARTIQVTATVTRVDKANQEVTLKGPRGKSVDVKVQNPENMELVKKGDLVEITYTEAVAISVDKVK